jgi:hypothetical protein
MTALRPPGCHTCNDTEKVDIDLKRPLWPHTEITPEHPSEILRDMSCPDCVPCEQCMHPDHDGIHTCRQFNPT